MTNLTPNLDSRLALTAIELRRQAQEDGLLAQTEAVYDLTGHQLAERFGDKFIDFVNELVEQEYNESQWED